LSIDDPASRLSVSPGGIVSAATTGRPIVAKFVPALCLAVILAIALTSSKFAPADSEATLVANLGFLLLAGSVLSELVGLLRLPHLTGYLLAGLLAGPHVLDIVDKQTAARLGPINTLALAMIALAGGAELRLDQLRAGFRSLLVATGVQSFLGLASSFAIFLALRDFIPFVSEVGTTAAIAIALLWSVLAISRSPSATLGILAQTHARGPVTTFSIAFVMSSDVVVVVLMALAMMVSKLLLAPGTELSFDAFRVLGHELAGSVSIGTTLGLMLVIYMRVVGRQLLVVFLALGFGASEILHYLNFDPLLTFLVAGFIVQNLSRQGEKFLHALEGMGSTVYVVFFASAGVDLDVPLLAGLWPIALLLAVSRAIFTIGAARLSNRLAKDAPVLQRWSWAALIAQAGLTQGLAGTVAREFPTFGPPFRALVVATLAINAVVGPILFKLALDRSGESKRAALLVEDEAT
jgi:Kef-type K+ transport system membrane component KefB